MSATSMSDDAIQRGDRPTGKRVGVIFGGRSSEHEVSLAGAHNVIDALRVAGHTVVPIGITTSGRWIASENALPELSSKTQLLAGQETPPTEGRANGSGSQTHSVEAGSGTAANETLPGWALLAEDAAGARLSDIDVIFPVLHGPYGEDGTIQGLLEMANIPYVGCGVAASSLAMDKALAKQLFSAAALPQTPWQVVTRAAWRSQPANVLSQIERTLSLPLFVKPANLGSSVGISRADDRGQLADALEMAARYDRKLIVEAAVPNAREIEVAVLGNDDPIASQPGEIVPGNLFYDYAAKYLDDNSDLLIPAPLEKAQAEQIRRMAVEAFCCVDGSGLARVDFLLDDQSGAIYLNEINTMPGFTRISMYPKLWAASGVDYPELVDRLLDLALERYEDRQRNETTRG